MRATIRRHLPRAAESLGGSGFPVYTDGEGKWLAGFAWRACSPMLYIMNAAILDRYEDRLGKLRSGKSCVEWRASRLLTMGALAKLTEQMLRDVARARARPKGHGIARSSSD
jgi:hypothetical protein